MDGSECKAGQPSLTDMALSAVRAERYNQEVKWGEQSHPDGTGSVGQKLQSKVAREVCDIRHSGGNGTWADILAEEFYEALAEFDTVKLRAELVQVAAVAVAWIEDIDRST